MLSSFGAGIICDATSDLAKMFDYIGVDGWNKPLAVSNVRFLLLTLGFITRPELIVKIVVLNQL